MVLGIAQRQKFNIKRLLLMPDYTSKEEQRQVYQREDQVEKPYIPAKPKADLCGEHRVFRTCAYCRVSTDNDEQISSFELQQAYYIRLVQDHPNWELNSIYADEGVSGASLNNRTQFNEMIEACKRGQYDLIVTKSLSRFSRNLDDCISLIQMLKRLTPPVGVYFEIENLYSLGEDAERIISFLETIAKTAQVTKSRLTCSPACVVCSTKWGKLRRHR